MADRGVPEDFAAFVTRYGHRLADACRDIAGNDRVADAMRVDLLAAVALGWRWRPARWRVRHALAKLDQLLRREVRSYRLLPTATRQIRMSGDDERTRRLEGDADGDVARLADAAWRRAGVLRRHGQLGVATAVLVLIGFAVIGPEAAPPDPPSPEPTSTPDGVTVLPPFGELRGRLQAGRSSLPTNTDLDPATMAALPQLSSAPLPRAIAVAEPNRGRLVVIGEDGDLRRVDDPILVSSRLVTTSLSPAGDLIALPRAGDLLVIDIRTGTIRSVQAGAVQSEQPALVWHTDHSVLLPGPVGALEVDVRTDLLADIPEVTGRDVVTAQGNPSAPFAEMLSGSSVGSQRSRIRLWRTPPQAVPPLTANPPAAPSGSVSLSGSAPASSAPPTYRAGEFEERPVSGPAWIGDWRGASWSSALLYARGCSPATLRLPADVGFARDAIGALQPNGRYAGTLVAVDNTQLEVLGFLRAHELLIAATSNNATMLLGWTPIGGDFAVIATFTDAVRVSVADLLLPS